MEKNHKILNEVIKYSAIGSIIGGSVVIYSSYIQLRPKEKLKLQMESSLYHDMTIDLKAMEDCERTKVATKFIEDMREYDVFNQDEYDIEKIKQIIADIIASNPYTDLANLSDRITVTTINDENKQNENRAILGSTLNVNNDYIDVLGIDISLYLNGDDHVYLHELIHSLYPPIEDSKFLEEAITDTITHEYIHNSTNGYPVFRPILSMLIETLGVDVFKEVQATGSIEPLITEIEKLGLTPEESKDIIDSLEKVYCYNEIFVNPNNKYIKENCPEVYNKDDNIDMDLVDMNIWGVHNNTVEKINDLYKLKYNRDAENNVIMQALNNELNSCFGLNQKYRYSRYYFSNKYEPELFTVKTIVSDGEEYKIVDPVYLSEFDMNIKVDKKESNTCR